MKKGGQYGENNGREAMADYWARPDDRGMRGRSAVNSRSSGTGCRTERFRLEYHETTAARRAEPSTVKLASFLLASLLTGCVPNSFSVVNPARALGSSSPLASEVLLEVDDVRVKWGAGKVGDAIKAALVKNRTFGEVHYPIYPTRSVPLKLQVLARGGIESDVGDGVAKSFITGFLLFLPAGVLQYRETFTISAEVSVIREGRRFGPLSLQSRVAADHTLFAGPDSYAARAGELALEDLAVRLSRALAEHPDWFSP